jgi:tetratricopeptide (TPR) repeat protein
VESLAGHHDVAAAQFAGGAAKLRAVGLVSIAETLEACVAREEFASGRTAEAVRMLDSIDANAADNDLRTRLITTALRGRISSAIGDHDLACTVTRQAAELGRGTDDLCLRGDVLCDLAEVLHRAGKPAEAETAARQALALYTAKGADLLAARARALTERPQSGGLREGEEG